jgi:2-iminobutanoate/2-iminopropanoate deaminase
MDAGASRRRYHAVKVSDSVTFVFVSGLTSRGPDGDLVGAGDIRAQTRQILENLKAILADAGATLDDVVRTVQYLRHMSDQPAMQAVKHAYLGNHRPASTSVEISRLFEEAMLIEIEATAVIVTRET